MIPNIHAFVSLLLVALPAASLLGEDPSAVQASNSLAAGSQIYQQSCASCHGDHGQGVADAYDQPLAGDATRQELAKLIADTMPEDDPDACVGEDAELVAAYIHETFYQPSVDAGDAPRIRLARLTAMQLRQSLADLYRFHENPLRYSDERGLKARYSNRDRDNKLEFERVDATIDFDFGHDGPGQGINAEDFTINWTGALQPEETGVHELIVHCENSFIMYFGERRREFINNHVQSAERTEFRESLFLTAGSVHPLAIRLTQRKRKTEQPPVKIRLSWKTPRGVEQVIPRRALVNSSAGPTFSLQTKLPADDRSYGYERGIAVDEQWNAATTKSAIEFANAVVAEAWPRYRRDHQDQPNGQRQVLRSFLTGIVAVAFRGQLNDALLELYVDQHLRETESDQEAIKRVLLLALKSPRFLYPLVDGDKSRSQRAANRLALTLFDSLPTDEWLREAAIHGQLESEQQIRDAARRMMGDWRVRAKTRDMLHAWLNFEHFDDLSKSAERHPKFDRLLEADLRASMDAFLEEIVWSGDSDFRELFLASWAYTTPRIANFYGDAWQPADAASLFGKTLQHEVHMGVLSHPLMMSGLAYDDSSSPIHRGVFLLRYALGRTLRPPNEAFTPFSPDLHPNLTTRERVALQTGEKSCQVCHSKINALGFALENFDAVGRYQTQQLGRAIDVSGSYTTRQGESVNLDGPRMLSEFLASHEDSHRAFINRVFQYLVKQPPAAFGPHLEQHLLDVFQQKQYSIYELIIEIAVATSFQPPTELVANIAN